MADLRALPNELDEKKACCRAIVETPRYCRSKFNYDPETNPFRLASLLPEGMVFPYDFGFIPSTLGEDGDPLDILVMLDEPAHVGCLVDVRIVGVIEAEQTEAGKKELNHRLLGVSSHSSTHEQISTIGDIGSTLLEQLEQFFVSCNQLRGKKFKVIGRGGPKRAVSLIRKGGKAWKTSQ